MRALVAFIACMVVTGLGCWWGLSAGLGDSPWATLMGLVVGLAGAVVFWVAYAILTILFE